MAGFYTSVLSGCSGGCRALDFRPTALPRVSVVVPFLWLPVLLLGSYYMKLVKPKQKELQWRL